ncbi:MAG: hypothetical protein DWQ04_24635, partial [Chloroflexi bacterium]
VAYSAKQEQAIAALQRRMTTGGVNSPSVKECKTAVGEDVYQSLLDLGRLKQVSHDVVYSVKIYEQLTGKIVTYLQKQGQINAAQARDILGTSRKYAIGLLEHLDDIKITRRVGDNRELY